MTFKEATDLLGVSTVELAERLGVSVALVRQARLGPESGGHRQPPAGWEAVVLEVARERQGELARLVSALEGA